MSKYTIALLLAASAVVGAAVTDRSAYLKAKKEDPYATFDWPLAFFRYAQAGLGVALPAVGIASVVPGD